MKKFFHEIKQILLSLKHGVTNDLLETIRAITRYLSQISIYKKELSIQISHSLSNLERLFCTLLQLCILKLNQIKLLIHKMAYQSQQSMPQNDLNDLNSSQNLIFSIMSLCLDSLINFMPNFADPNYLITIDEYKLLLDTHLSMPSSFDLQTSLSFGSILWLIEYCLKLLQKHESVNVSSTVASSASTLKSTTTPNKLNESLTNELIGSPSKRNVTILANDESDGNKSFRSLYVCVLEKVLNFLLTQIILCDRQTQFSIRDRKIFKRDLGAEIVSIILYFDCNYSILKNI